MNVEEAALYGLHTEKLKVLFLSINKIRNFKDLYPVFEIKSSFHMFGFPRLCMPLLPRFSFSISHPTGFLKPFFLQTPEILFLPIFCRWLFFGTVGTRQFENPVRQLLESNISVKLSGKPLQISLLPN